jgi:enoyl-CoA hydratase
MPNVISEFRNDAYWLTLNRPAALNALGEQLVLELVEAFEKIAGTGVPVVLTGEGRAFCAGGDLKWFLEGIYRPELLQRYLGLLGKLFERIYAHDGVTIAAVNGLAVAGGLELVCLCDLSLAVETAKFADSHVNYGLHPGGGASELVRRRIGEERARWLLLTGDFIEAAEAQRIGLINQVVPPNRLVQDAAALATRVARHSRAAVREIKRLMAVDVRAVLQRELASLHAHLQQPETRAQLERFAARSK